MFKSIRWQGVWLLFLAGVINYTDRSAVSVAAPLIQKDLHLNAAEMGLIFSSFFIGYATFAFVGGLAADRLGPTRVMQIAMAFWSCFCALTAGAFNFVSLFVIRIFFGVGEGPLSTTCSKFVSNWFPRNEAASAMGVVTSGTPLRGAISGPVIGLLSLAFGWRPAFLIIGGVGILWVILWSFLAADTPAEHSRVRAAERALIEAGQQENPVEAAHEKLGPYLRSPTVLATAGAFFGYNYVLFFS